MAVQPAEHEGADLDVAVGRVVVIDVLDGVGIYAVPLSGLLTLMAYNGAERVSQRDVIDQQKRLVQALNDPDSGLKVVAQRHHIETLRAS